MLKNFFLAAMITFAANSQPLFAQVSDQDVKDIKALYNAFDAAFEKSDAAAVANLFTENGTHISPEGNITQGRKNLQVFFTKLLEYFKSMPKPDQYEERVTDWNNRYLAPGLVLITYLSEEIRTTAGKSNSIKHAISVIARKESGNWKADAVCMTPVAPPAR